MTADADELRRLRAEMDAVNDRLQRVLQERGALCARIAAWKRARGLPAVDAAREREMLSHLLRSPGDGFDRAALERIWSAVLAESRAVVERGAQP